MYTSYVYNFSCLPYIYKQGASYNLRIYALQSSSSFPETPRQYERRYLDEGHPYTNGYHLEEGHPYTYNPLKHSDMGLSNAMRRNRVVNDERSGSSSHHNINQYDSSSIQPMNGEEQLQYQQTNDEIPQQPLLHTRRTFRDQATSSLLTFEQEKYLIKLVKRASAVKRVRSDMMEWLSKDFQQCGGITNLQWANACFVTVDQLHEVLSGGQEARERLRYYYCHGYC